MRYRKARAMGKEAYEKAVREDGDLLKGFGMGLLSVENGVRLVNLKQYRGGKVNPWDVIHISPKFWAMVRPLLVELQGYRSRATTAASSPSLPEGRERLHLGAPGRRS